MSGAFEESVEFRMRENFDDADAVRLVVTGELDLAVAAMFGDRLRMLRDAGHAVRLDLAELEFIDSCGLRELIFALNEARSNGWRLDVDPQVHPTVRRTVAMAGLTSYLWPEEG